MATYVPSENLRAKYAAHRAAVAAEEAALEDLRQAIADEMKPTSPKVKAADVARFLGYHPGHVTRIARARGVEGDPTRKPPAPRTSPPPTT